MRGEMTIIRADGEVMGTPYGKPIPQQHFWDAVGGYTETVPYFTTYEGKQCVAFCDEEGKLKGKPLNAAAQTLWEAQWPVRLADYLVGDVVIVTGDISFMREL